MIYEQNRNMCDVIHDTLTISVEICHIFLNSYGAWRTLWAVYKGKYLDLSHGKVMIKVMQNKLT